MFASKRLELCLDRASSSAFAQGSQAIKSPSRTSVGVRILDLPFATKPTRCLETSKDVVDRRMAEIGRLGDLQAVPRLTDILKEHRKNAEHRSRDPRFNHRGII